MAALNPSLTSGTQLREVLYYHGREHEATERVGQMLREVRLPDPERIMAAYPHQLAGGQQQRLVIARALLAQPSLLLDEPTTALDTTIAAGMVDLIGERRHRFATSMLYISHDLGRLMEICDRQCVMYAGQSIETEPTAQVFDTPRHPYTRGLLRALPLPGTRKQTRPLRSIHAQPPALTQRPAGAHLAPAVRRFSPACAMPPCGAAGALCTLA